MYLLLFIVNCHLCDEFIVAAAFSSSISCVSCSSTAAHHLSLLNQLHKLTIIFLHIFIHIFVGFSSTADF